MASDWLKTNALRTAFVACLVLPAVFAQAQYYTWPDTRIDQAADGSVNPPQAELPAWQADIALIEGATAVLVWVEALNPQGQRVVCRKVSPAGTPLNEQITIVSSSNNSYDLPKVTATSTGGYTVFWREFQATHRLFCSVYSRANVLQDGFPLAVNISPIGSVTGPIEYDVANNLKGQIAVIWREDFFIGGATVETRLIAHVFTEDGTGITTQNLPVNYAYEPAVCALADGQFALAYATEPNSLQRPIMLSIQSADLVHETTNTRVDLLTRTEKKYRPTVATDDLGRILVGWEADREGTAQWGYTDKLGWSLLGNDGAWQGEFVGQAFTKLEPVKDPAFLGQVRARRVGQFQLGGFRDGTVLALWREQQDIVTGFEEQEFPFPITSVRQIIAGRLFSATGGEILGNLEFNTIPANLFESGADRPALAVTGQSAFLVWDDRRTYLTTYPQGLPNIWATRFSFTSKVFSRLDYDGDGQMGVYDLLQVAIRHRQGGRLSLTGGEQETPGDLLGLARYWRSSVP